MGKERQLNSSIRAESEGGRSCQNKTSIHEGMSKWRSAVSDGRGYGEHLVTRLDLGDCMNL